jgi:hypothetical protein
LLVIATLAKTAVPNGLIHTSHSSFPYSPALRLPLATAKELWLPLYDHLRDTSTTQRLATLESLALDTSQRIHETGNQQEDGSGNQTRWPCHETDPLNDAHDAVNGSAHIVCLEFADEGIELRGRRADAEEKWDFEKDDDKGTHSVAMLVGVRVTSGRRYAQANDGEGDAAHVGGEYVGDA